MDTTRGLKALLTHQAIDVPRIHDIGELVQRADLRVGLTVEEMRLLTDYGTVTRYPGDYEPVELEEARRAVALAREVRSSVRKRLPRAAKGSRA